MNRKRFLIYKAIVVIAFFVMMVGSLTAGIKYLPLISGVIALILLFTLSNQIRGTVLDERDYKICGRAAIRTYQTFIITGLVVGTALKSMDGSKTIEIIGNTIIGSMAFIIIAYVVFYLYYRENISKFDQVNKLETQIKEYRVKKDLTQKELAEAVDVRRETIVYLEKGEYNPSLKLAHKVAKALDAEIDDLFIFEDDKIKEKQNKMEGEK